MARPCDAALFDQWKGDRTDAGPMWSAMVAMMRDPWWKDMTFVLSWERWHIMKGDRRFSSVTTGPFSGEIPWR